MTPSNGPQSREARPWELTLRESLIRMVWKMTDDPECRADLLQEATLQLWRVQTQRPGQTRSWYLQSCRFRIQHYLAAGRSVDSAKRRNGWLELDPESEHGERILNEADSSESVFASVSARDILAQLATRLENQERRVLHCFAEGMGAREIGRKLKISHTMVIKYRRRIATLLQRLETPKVQVPRMSGVNGNGKSHARHNGEKREAA
jgi:RNA polymerase sigma factor (sigma-70 family)